MTDDNTSQSVKTENVEMVQLVIFSLAGEEYGVEITDLQEIIKIPDITPIPNSPDFIEGIIDLRGKIAVIMDLKKRFSLHATEEGDADEKRIIISEIESNVFGLVVDNVKEVKKVPKDSIKKTPELVSNKIHAEYLKGVSVLEDRLILLLDLNKVLSEKDLAELSDLAGATKPKAAIEEEAEPEHTDEEAEEAQPPEAKPEELSNSK